MAKNIGLITSRCSKMSPHTVFSVPHIFYKFNLLNTEDTSLIVKHFLWAPLNVHSKQGLTVMDMSKISTQALRA